MRRILNAIQKKISSKEHQAEYQIIPRQLFESNKIYPKLRVLKLQLFLILWLLLSQAENTKKKLKAVWIFWQFIFAMYGHRFDFNH